MDITNIRRYYKYNTILKDCSEIDFLYLKRLLSENVYRFIDNSEGKYITTRDCGTFFKTDYIKGDEIETENIAQTFVLAVQQINCDYLKQFIDYKGKMYTSYDYFQSVPNIDPNSEIHLIREATVEEILQFFKE